MIDAAVHVGAQPIAKLVVKVHGAESRTAGNTVLLCAKNGAG